MQHTIQQRRMHTKPTRLTRQLPRQRDLDKHLLTTSPHTPQTLKHRAILETQLRQLLVHTIDTHLDPTHNRPYTTQLTYLHTPTTRRQHPSSMLHPGAPAQPPIPRTRIHPHTPTPELIRPPNPPPHLPTLPPA